MAPWTFKNTDEVEDNRKYIPNSSKDLRACLGCRLIMPRSQFLEYGCPTCEHFQMKDIEGRVVACTTSNFHGFCANIKPGAFVSRFVGLDRSRPGLYALTVQGEVPDYIMNEDVDPAAVRQEALRKSLLTGQSALEKRLAEQSRAKKEEEPVSATEDEKLPPLVAAADASGASGQEGESGAESGNAEEGEPGVAEPKKKRLRRIDDGEASDAAPLDASAGPPPHLRPLESESDGEFKRGSGTEAATASPRVAAAAPAAATNAFQASDSDGEFLGAGTKPTEAAAASSAATAAATAAGSTVDPFAPSESDGEFLSSAKPKASGPGTEAAAASSATAAATTAASTADPFAPSESDGEFLESAKKPKAVDPPAASGSKGGEQSD